MAAPDPIRLSRSQAAGGNGLMDQPLRVILEHVDLIVGEVMAGPIHGATCESRGVHHGKISDLRNQILGRSGPSADQPSARNRTGHVGRGFTWNIPTGADLDPI
jgi:hypothetical protein